MFKKRKKDKEIDAKIKEIFSEIPLESQIQLLKDSGLSAEKTAAAVKYAADSKTTGKNGHYNFTTNDLDLVNKQALTSVKAMIYELNEMVHFTEGSFADALAEDAFELISLLSLMSMDKTDFQNYSVEYYNYLFDFLNKPVDSFAVENYLRSIGLGNIYVSNKKMFVCTGDQWKIIDSVVSSTPKGLNALYRQLILAETNVDLMKSFLAAYQMVISLIGTRCLGVYEGKLQRNFIVLLNNWLFSVSSFIPERFLTKEFILTLQQINNQMHQHDK